MIRERLKENYQKTSETKRCDFVEWVIICNYMDNEDFHNLFRLEELNEGEFFSIIDFLCKQECYMTLFMIIARHLKWFQNEDISFIEDTELIVDIERRIERLKEFKDFVIPEL